MRDGSKGSGIDACEVDRKVQRCVRAWLALRACSRVRPAPADTQRKFAAFVAAVQRYLPDDGADSVWPEGLPGNALLSIAGRSRAG